MTEWLSASDPDAPAQAAAVIRSGGLVVMPTDTVYGVAADLWNPDAVAALYAAKQRPPELAIPILLAGPSGLALVASHVPKAAEALGEAFWPGPLTIVVPKRADIPEIVSQLPTVGVRIPDHPAARMVIRACGGALAVSSANRSGGPAARTARAAADALGDAVALVLDGGTCPGGTPSTVVDATGEALTVLREGPVSAAALQTILVR